MSPGSAWIDALVDHVNEEAEEEQASMNMTVENILEDDADKIVTTYKRNGADVRIVKNSDGTVNLSIRSKGGSSIQDVVTGPNGLVCMTVDGVTTTTTGSSAMEQLKPRGSYRRAPEVGAPLAHAAMKPSAWHRRWWHYLKRYVRENKRSVMYALLVSPVLQLIFRGSFSLAWVAGYVASIPIIALAMTLVGSYNLRKAMQARAKRLVRNGWPRLEVKGHPGSVPVPFVFSPTAPISEQTGAHPIESTNDMSEVPVEIRDLVRMLKKQQHDSGRTAMIKGARLPSMTVAMAARLLKAFRFDSARLDAMMSIGPKVTDPENAHMIVDAFDFDSSTTPAMKSITSPPTTPRRTAGRAYR